MVEPWLIDAAAAYNRHSFEQKDGYVGLILLPIEHLETVLNWSFQSLPDEILVGFDPNQNLPHNQEIHDFFIGSDHREELHQGEGLQRHVHGNRFHPMVKTSNFFLNCNIFLGGEYNITWYKDIGEVKNTQGDIHIFSSNLEHEVYTNTGTDIRHSMALDIYPNLTTLNMFNSQRFRIYKRDPAV